MTDPRTRATLRDLERAGMDRDRESLREAEARVAEADRAWRALHTLHDANVAARHEARAAMTGTPDARALARWSDDDEARRRSLDNERAELQRRARELADASAVRDKLAQALAARLARLQALRDAPPEEPSDG